MLPHVFSRNLLSVYLLVTYEFPISEGDAYFTVKLQDYTAVEKDDIILDCELSKEVPVKWYHNDTEIKASKMVTMKAEGKRRILSLKRAEDKNKGNYICDCGTDKTMANINIEGKHLKLCSHLKCKTKILICTPANSPIF